MSSAAQPESRQALADTIRNDHLHGNRRRSLRQKFLLIGLVILACGAAIWVQLAAAQKQEAGAAVPRNATAEFGFLSDGPAVAGATPVVIYEDFLCSSCSLFHQETAPYLAEQVASGTITVEYRPFSFLVGASPNEYSQRAANAAACVADLGGVSAFVQMHDTLLEHQPAHGAAGPDDAQLTQFAQDAGVADAASCITERRFSGWVNQALAAAVTAGVKVTPTIRVGDLEVVRSENGQETMPGLEELKYAIEQVAAQ